MGDAIVEFVKTGKLEFSSLISSMLEDLVKYELKQQSMALYNAAKTSVNDAGGFAGLLGKLLGSAGGAASAADAAAPVAYGVYNAKGNAFDYGIEKYAKGGAFTNQVVDSPTLFKFAKGTGMMGEAGPEAIMPLKRDAQGNLGVRSGQQQTNVDVVVNNYGNEQATTTQTTDSRGNRRIEVTIGDMTAGEVGRSGSASQRSLRSTYGLQPQLIRR
jgi:lambda family phage tail tape measure protein